MYGSQQNQQPPKVEAKGINSPFQKLVVRWPLGIPDTSGIIPDTSGMGANSNFLLQSWPTGTFDDTNTGTSDVHLYYRSKTGTFGSSNSRTSFWVAWAHTGHVWYHTGPVCPD
jgi:hypothetical protein